MGQTITYNFSDNFIEKVAVFLLDQAKRKKDLSRTAIIFGGKRPALFLKRELAGKLGSAYIPPQFFTINEFVQYIVKKQVYILK